MAAAAMIFPTFPRPDDEPARLAALHRLADPAQPAGAEFTFLTVLAATLCGTPCAALMLVDAERVHVAAATGLETGSLPRSQSCCAHAILADGVTEYPDLAGDARLAGAAAALTPLTTAPPAPATAPPSSAPTAPTAPAIPTPLSSAATITPTAPPIRFYAAAPLRTADGHAIGTLAVLDTRPGTLTASQRAMLQGLAAQALALLTGRASTRALQTTRQQLEQVATRDEATGLLNRRALLHRLQFEVARARRFRTPLCAILLAPNGLPLHDAQVPGAGERILAAVGKLVRANIRMIDIAARFDDERLCLLLPNTPPDGARKLADTLAARIAALEHVEGARRFHVTVRCGIGAFDDMRIHDADGLLAAAAAALATATAAP